MGMMNGAGLHIADPVGAAVALGVVMYILGMAYLVQTALDEGYKWLALTVGGIALLMLGLGAANAQEHHGHRPQDMALHSMFYRSWMMPDNRAISCCHEEDCRPAEAYQKDGKWYARQDGDDGDFTAVPPAKVEQERDSPDGRSHLCGRRYGFNGSSFSVFCFLPASGS